MASGVVLKERSMRQRSCSSAWKDWAVAPAKRQDDPEPSIGNTSRGGFRQQKGSESKRGKSGTNGKPGYLSSAQRVFIVSLGSLELIATAKGKGGMVLELGDDKI